MWFILVLTVILILWLLQSPFYWNGKGIPWVIPLPVFGNVLGILFTPINLFWKGFYDKYKESGVLGIHFFSSPTLVVTHPDVINQVLVTKATSFRSHGLHLNANIDPFANNLFFSEGEHWRILRKRISPFFTPVHLKPVFGFIEESVSSFVTVLDRRKTCVDVHDLSSKLSTDIIVKICFGVECNVFSSSLKKKKSPFLQVLQESSSNLVKAKILIGMLSPGLFDMLKLTLFSQELTSNLSSFVEDIIKERSEGIGVRQDFIQSMITQMSQHSQGELDEVTAQSVIMLVAGSETTAHSIAFMLHELAVNQSVQDKLRAELSDFLEFSDGKVTYEEITSLKYTNLVINETLRKYPPIGTILRQCTMDSTLTISEKELPIRKGTRLVIPIYGFHQDRKFYQKPNCFLPERKAVPYLPFGLGPRMCIGMKLALLEMAYLLIKVIPYYTLEPCKKTKDPLPLNRGSSMVAPQGGVWIQAVPIS